MPITRYTASADTTITNIRKPLSDQRAIYANMGAADSLELFSLYNKDADAEISRILINFSLDEISSSLSLGRLPDETRFFLKLFNVEHHSTLPKNYYVIVRPVSSSWEEGEGLDLDNYTDIGQSGSNGVGANWIFRTTTETPNSWYYEGGDYINTSSYTFYFEKGTEDLSIDVTDIVRKQIDLTLPRNGFLISLSGAYEDGTREQDYYTKKFSARSSEYFYKRPVLEARWESIIRDDRNDFYFESPNLSTIDNTQNLYFYNKVNGVLKNINNNPTVLVKINDSLGNSLIESVTASNISAGIYKASLTVPDHPDEELLDIWYSGSVAFYTGSIDAKKRIFSDSFYEEENVFTLQNLKRSYNTYEKANIKIFSRQKNWNPNIYNVATTEIETKILKELYYKVYRIVDNLTIIDYGVDPIPYTKCSYDKNGNYFELDMSIFEPGYMYGIKLMVKNENNMVEYSNIFKFKVE